MMGPRSLLSGVLIDFFSIRPPRIGTAPGALSISRTGARIPPKSFQQDKDAIAKRIVPSNRQRTLQPFSIRSAMPDPVYRFMFDIGASLYVLSGGSCPFPGQNDALSQRTFNPLPISPKAT